MILVDSSVWIDHLRQADTALIGALERREVLTHSFVIGELALGSLRARETIISALQNLPKAQSAGETEVLAFIRAAQLFGRGIGYVDAHLLASVKLTSDARLWTRDKRLHAVAQDLGLD